MFGLASRVQDLEIAIQKQDKIIQGLMDMNSPQTKEVIYSQDIDLGMGMGTYRTDIPMNKVIRLILNHLGLSVRTVRATPEHVDLIAIDKGDKPDE